MHALERQRTQWDEEVVAQRHRIIEGQVALRNCYAEVESHRRQLRRAHKIRKTQDELREAHHCLEGLRKSAYTTKAMSLASKHYLDGIMSLVWGNTLNPHHITDRITQSLKESLINSFMASPMNVSPTEFHNSSPQRFSPPIPAPCYSSDTYADTIIDQEVILFVFPCSFQAEYLRLPERIPHLWIPACTVGSL